MVHLPLLSSETPHLTWHNVCYSEPQLLCIINLARPSSVGFYSNPRRGDDALTSPVYWPAGQRGVILSIFRVYKSRATFFVSIHIHNTAAIQVLVLFFFFKVRSMSFRASDGSNTPADGVPIPTIQTRAFLTKQRENRRRRPHAAARVWIGSAPFGAFV